MCRVWSRKQTRVINSSWNPASQASSRRIQAQSSRYAHGNKFESLKTRFRDAAVPKPNVHLRHEYAPSSQNVGSCCCGVACRGNAHLIRRFPLPLIQSHSHPEETEFMTVFSSSSCSFRAPFLSCLAYEVGLGFICYPSAPAHPEKIPSLRTLRLPPVMVTLTKRRVYVSLFFARPLGVFFFSWGST